MEEAEEEKRRKRRKPFFDLSGKYVMEEMSRVGMQ